LTSRAADDSQPVYNPYKTQYIPPMHHSLSAALQTTERPIGNAQKKGGKS
jgi:hypothetical protein